MNRRTFRCLIVLCCGWLALLLLALFAKMMIDRRLNHRIPPRVNFITDKLPGIKLGMTKDQLTEHLGKPPGEYQSGPIGPTNPPLLFLGEPVGNEAKHIKWSDDAAELYVAFDADGKMIFAFACTTELRK